MMRLVVLLLLVTNTVRSQEFELKFLRQNYEKYRYAEVKLREDHAALDYMLYDSLHHCQQLVNHHVAYPLEGVRYRTDPTRIKGRIFTVADILDNASSLLHYPVFILRDVAQGDSLYFKYNPNSIDKFPFIVNGVVGKEDEYCHLLEKKYLPITNEVYMHTPNRGTVQEVPLSLFKTTDGTQVNYMLHLRAYGTRPHSRVRGVSVYLNDGSRIYRNSAIIQFKQTKYGYEYSVSIRLSDNELEKLLNSTVSKHQLYIYNYQIPKAFGTQFMMLSKCLKKAQL